MDSYILQDNEIFILYRNCVIDMLKSHAFYNLSVEDINKIVKDYFELLQKMEPDSLIERIYEGEEND